MTRTELVVVDLREVRTEAGIHAALARSLGFPAWYGSNWDALWDAITGLVEMPSRLELRGWTCFEAHAPEAAQSLRALFAEMSTELPGLASEVVFD